MPALHLTRAPTSHRHVEGRSRRCWCGRNQGWNHDSPASKVMDSEDIGEDQGDNVGPRPWGQEVNYRWMATLEAEPTR